MAARIPLSRRRKALFCVVTLIIVWTSAESLSYLGLKAAIENFSLAKMHRQRTSIARGLSSDGAAEVIHPYLGWCFDPNVAEPVEFDGRTIPVNKLGFLDDKPSVAKRRDDEFLLGIAGGSVAWQVSVAGESVLRETLEASPLLQGRKVRLVRMAMSGYKQPQQVMMLNYLLSLGGEFDAVINIDGYNETALSVGENHMAGVAISYPRSWQARTIAIADPRESAETAELVSLRGQRQQMARFLVGSPLRFSPLVNLLWKLRDDQCRSGLLRLAGQLTRSTRQHQDRSFASYGPDDNLTDPRDVAASVVDLWVRSSVLMDRVCHGHHTVYVHLLQANQYHEGSKPMTWQEKRDSIAPSQRAGKAARALYPALVAAGPRLREAGVNFSDQTMLFANIHEPIYADGWCHYNTRGNQLMARTAAEQLLLALSAESP